MKITIIILTLTAMSAGIFFINVKNVWADMDSWLSYEIAYEDGVIRLKVPPNHRFKGFPPQRYVLLDDAKPVRQIFSAQYDFGWLRLNDIAHFEVLYTLVRLPQPFSNNTSLVEIKSHVNDILRNRLGKASAAESWQAETVSLENGNWIRSFDPSDSFAESFMRRCGAQVVLIVSPAYFIDRRKDSHLEWLKIRQSLFRKMVSSVQCS